ncbi:hypothetical protein AMATHDRAFT_1703 [Amanita thiersii Skay4041]|uniref:Uncharacterized protein n=1 Tax=Amanita thiersii Skay4041 TaxID=703135 RepID=A0A2A9NX39_9AGAR|nr:hypothetical protein AMATHDRAFT_1703 [Amanita thiersii Skay4041]
MAPGRPVRNITIKVPRQNAQRTGLKLAAEIKKQARAKKIPIDIGQPHPDLNQAIESASEWNSLLMTARAERGPQWDVGTQQFLVDEHSELYYDPTPLLEAVKKKQNEEKAEEQAAQQAHVVHQHHPLSMHQMQHPHQQLQHPRHESGTHQEFHLHQLNQSMHQTPTMQRHHGPVPGGPVNFPPPFPASPVGNMGMRPPPPPAGSPFGGGSGGSGAMGVGPGAGPGSGGGSPFGGMQAGQFYGNDMSPVRMGGMSGGMGNVNMGSIGNMGGMGSMGMTGGMGGMGNMGGMGGLGNLGNMGGLGGMGGVGNLGGMGGMGGMGMMDHGPGMGGHPMNAMGNSGSPGAGAGMPLNMSPGIRRQMSRGGFGDDAFGLH